MLDEPISPLRQRMIDDMTARRFKEKVQKDYGRSGAPLPRRSSLASGRVAQRVGESRYFDDVHVHHHGNCALLRPAKLAGGSFRRGPQQHRKITCRKTPTFFGRSFATTVSWGNAPAPAPMPWFRARCERLNLAGRRFGLRSSAALRKYRPFTDSLAN